MAWTAEQARNELARVGSVDELKKIIDAIEVSHAGDPTLLFSGSDVQNRWYGNYIDDFVQNGSGVRSIRETEVAKFLDLRQNPELVDVLERVFDGDDPTRPGTKAFNFLNGKVVDGKRIPNGIWDEVSTRFARETTGEVTTLIALGKGYGTFALAELPALLENPNVTAIDGLPREHLQDLYRKTDLTTVFNAVALNSQVRITLSGVAAGDLSSFLGFSNEDMATALEDPVKRDAVTALMVDADPQTRAAVRSGIESLLAGGELSGLNGASRVLNRMGYVGGILSLLVVSSQAASAGSSEEAAAIMEQWAVEAVGGEIGSIIGGAAAGIALAAVGVASAPVVVALVLGASLVGGFVGAEWSNDFYDALGEQDGPDRTRVLGQLAEVYFGAGALPTADSIPAAGGSFSWIDPALSAQDIYQAAQGDLAWRYALAKLNPFVVGGVDYGSLHNAQKELDLYDSAAGSGLTDQYLMARAEALHTYVTLFNDGIDHLGRDFPAGYYPHFYDPTVQSESASEEAVVDLDIGSDNVPQLLFGNARGEVIRGGDHSDKLFGDAGRDHLDGGAGADYLEGGKDFDTYVVTDGDSLFDQDGSGWVLFDDELLTGGVRLGQGTAYASADGALRYDPVGDDLKVTRIADGTSVRIIGYRYGDLGIDLEERHPGAPINHLVTRGGPEPEVFRGQINLGVLDLELLNAWNLPDHILGEGGRDWIYAWDDGPQRIEDGVVINSAPDTDIAEGGPGKDFIHGGAGDDVLYATDSSDAASVIQGLGSLAPFVSGPQEGDFVSGQSGADELYGSGRLDGLFGGDGDDLIYGGAGDDIIDGDRSAVVTPASMNPVTHDYTWHEVDDDGIRQLYLFDYVGGIGNDRIHAGEGDDLVWGGAADDTIYGDAGNDRIEGDLAGVDTMGQPLLPGALHGDDLLLGGAGNDVIDGNNGDDILYGGVGDDQLDGDSRVLVGGDAALHGDDYLSGGVGHDILSGSGGADFLLGGTGNDSLFGDLDGLHAGFHGADTLDGGAGNDVLVGQGDDDTLRGGVGDDKLYGDDVDQFVLSGNDNLFGGAGADELYGGLGNDMLAGGEDGDSLWGDAGDDRLSGGQGADYLEGGAGADTYLFSAGDSATVAGQFDTILDTSGEGNVLEFSSNIDPDSISFTLIGYSGDIQLHYGADDTVYIHAGLTGSIDKIAVNGGAPSPFTEALSHYIENAYFLEGSAGDDRVFGSGSSDYLVGGEGDDILIAGAGNDVLNGGRGVDRLVGGAGTDTYDIVPNAGSTEPHSNSYTIIDSADRSSVVRFGSEISVSDISSYQESSSPANPDISISSPLFFLYITNGKHGNVVDRFEFANGEVYTLDQLKSLILAPLAKQIGTDQPDTINGTPGNDSLSTGGGADNLYGGNGRDRLDGGAGADYMEGGSGLDTYVVDDSGDVVSEELGGGYDSVEASISYTLPAHVESLELTGMDPLAGTGNELNNTLLGNHGDNVLSGGGGNDYIDSRNGVDVIYGGAGDDFLQGNFQIFGGEGNDRLNVWPSNLSTVPQPELSGGSGDDVYWLNNRSRRYLYATITEAPDEGIDTLILYAHSISLYELPSNVENLRYDSAGPGYYTNAARLTGNDLDNRIEIGYGIPDGKYGLYGLGGDDTLIGSEFDDSGPQQGLFGGEGHDVLRGMAGNDYLEGGAGNDTLEGGDGADALHGGDGSDNIVGGLGDDLLDGGAGLDVFDGGEGADTYVFRPGDGSAWIRDVAGQNSIDFRDGITVDAITDIAVDDTNLVVRYSGESEIVIRDGAIRTVVDRFVFEADGTEYSLQELRALADNRFENAFSGGIEDDTLRGTSQRDLIEGNEGNDHLYGRYGNDRLVGGAGNDRLHGEAGDDQMIGGEGDDRYYVDATGDTLFEAPNAGNDRVYARIDHTLGDNFEEVVLLGEDGLQATGNALNNRLFGNVGANTLRGGLGDDRLHGRGGNDQIWGGAGNDILNGQAGDDEMIGGEGDDRYYVDSVDDTIYEYSSSVGYDRVFASVDYTLAPRFESLTLLGEADLRATGNWSDNRLYGNLGANILLGEYGDDLLFGRDGNDRLIGGAGNDILNGQAGDDEMIGGEGDDRYYVDAAGDMVTEEQDAGYDRVYAYLDYALTDNIEELRLVGQAALQGTGGAADDRLYGNTGSNQLSGAAGDDRLIGGDGDDVLVGGPGNDRLFGGLGNDVYRFASGDGRDVLNEQHGASASDVLEFADLNHDELWFEKSGNHLVVSVIGTDEQISISNWYRSADGQIELFSSADSLALSNSSIDQLVSAMAGFTKPPSGETALSAELRDDLSPVLAAAWQPA